MTSLAEQLKEIQPYVLAWIQSASYPTYSRVLVVDPSGVGDHTTLTDALAAITDAASDNRYCVMIYGNTTEPSGAIMVKEFVSVIGSKKDTIVTCDGLKIGDGTHLWHRGELVNLYIANLGSGTVGLDIFQADEIILRGCSISGFGTGIRIDHYQSGLVQIDDSAVSNCAIGVEVLSAYSLNLRGCNLFNTNTVFQVQACLTLSVTDTAIDTFDTMCLFDNTAAAVSALSVLFHNCRFLSASGGAGNDCRVVKFYSGADDYQGVVRGLILRDCTFWLTNAKYVIEVAWNGHLSGGSNRFSAILDDLYIQGERDTINTAAWTKSDCASDGFVNIAIGNLIADDAIAVQDGTQPIVSGYGHLGIDLGSVAGASLNGGGALLGKNRWGADGSDATRFTHGLADLAAGSAVVNTTKVTDSSMIFLSENSQRGNGYVWVSARTPGTSFTIQSSSAEDNCTVAWLMIEP